MSARTYVSRSHALGFAAELGLSRNGCPSGRLVRCRRQRNAAEPSGRFRCVLALVRHTGRRVNAIVSLRASDVLLTRQSMRAALAAYAMDLAHADAWPQGAIRWGAATDNLGFEAVTPISTEARAAVDMYLREHPKLVDAPLFASIEDASRARRCSARHPAPVRSAWRARMPG